MVSFILCFFSLLSFVLFLFFSAQLSVRVDRSRGSWGGAYIVWVGGLLGGSLQ